jgi:hypothetical protein
LVLLLKVAFSLSDFKKSGFIDLIGKKNIIERLGQTKKISRLTTFFHY